MRSIWPGIRIVAILLLSTAVVNGQDGESSNPYKGMALKDRLFFGGDLGLSFGNFTFVRVAPIVGYHVSPKFGFGLGPSYQYWRYDALTASGPARIETHIYGMNTFARFFPIEQGFIQTDFELLNLRTSFRDAGNFFDESESRVTVPVWLVGAGFVQRSGRGGFMVGIFYDLIQDINSPYGRDLIFRGGVFF